ncbi:MAG: glycosyltransferase [Acidobacteria bacterium]|nr:glycosyltransferase [Acidobacteriota bacterium]
MPQVETEMSNTAEASQPASSPKLSVVVTSTGGDAYLTVCLDGLLEQAHGVELVVAVVGDEATARRVREAYPEVHLLSFERGLSLPQARYRALQVCKGEVVAFTKDTCTVRRDWCRRLMDLHRQNSHGVIGGAIDFCSREDGCNWAAFFCEYACLLPPLLQSKDPAMSNVSYKRQILETFKEVFSSGNWETLTHENLHTRGVRFLARPDLLVDYRKTFGFTEFLTQRYHFARSFAGMRAAQVPLWRRVFWTLGSPFLPVLFLTRLTRLLIPVTQYRKKFLASSPWLLLFLCAGAWGELRGYLQGAGDSAVKVH